MSASVKRSPRRTAAAPLWHEKFLRMLPVIRQCASIAFRHLNAEAREEAIQDVAASSLVAFVRLVERGKADLAFGSVLAKYGIAQFRSGRRVGTRMNVRDVSSEYCQQRKGVFVQRLSRFVRQDGTWREAVVEDRRTPVPDLVSLRIDFPIWLSRLSRRNRRIAVDLAMGNGPTTVARKHGLSNGRVSQLRREFAENWREFHGEAVEPAAASA